jgi:glycosyltransferase involved in cell wall biosynthesis
MSRTHAGEIATRAEASAAVTDAAGRGVAVLIPCYNEEPTVARVVARFREELPGAHVYVFDNNSTDRTADEARRAGAHVFVERRQGKGYVVQSMFRQVDADFYVMVDGDDTYPPEAVHALLAPVAAGEADMSVGSRLHADSRSQFRRRNRLANQMVRSTLNFIFGVRLTDILSGYRAFSREFVKGLPLFGGGFEIETELTIKAVERGFRLVEVPVNLTHRPEGSHSKIQFLRDGFLILNTTLALFRDYKPLTFFGGVGLFLFLLAFLPGALALFGLAGAADTAPRLTATVISVGLFLCGLLSLTAGLILHSIARRSQEFEYHMRVLADELRAGRSPHAAREGREHSDAAHNGDDGTRYVEDDAALNGDEAGR